MSDPANRRPNGDDDPDYRAPQESSLGDSSLDDSRDPDRLAGAPDPYSAPDPYAAPDPYSREASEPSGSTSTEGPGGPPEAAGAQAWSPSSDPQQPPPYAGAGYPPPASGPQTGGYPQDPANPYGAPTGPGQGAYGGNPYETGQQQSNPYQQAPYEQAPYEQTQYEQTPYEQTQYEQPNPYGQPYEQNPYGQPYQGGPVAYSPYGGPAPQQHPQAVVALVTGILGLAICPPVGIAGLVLGQKVKREVDAEPQRYTGRGFGVAGFVLGILSIVYLVLLVVLIGIGAATGFE